MAREFYKPEVKEAIFKAIKDARAGGKKFEDQYKAAKDAGYKGGEGALRVLISKAGIVKGRKRGRKAKIATIAPAQINNGRRRGRKPGVRAAGGLTEVERLVQAEVTSRINAALDEAIKALQALKQ